MSNVYSFKNVSAAITGAGGVLNLGNGAAAAEEGISIDPVEDKNIMQVGADGKGQHSLIASDAKTITVRLLKTSPINQGLMNMYNLQSSSILLWGQNIITVSDARGDLHVLQACAFKKVPNLNYAKEAGVNEWIFDCIAGNSILGV